MEAQNQEENTDKEIPEKTSETTVSETIIAAKSALPSANSSPSHEFSFTISLNSTQKTSPSSPTLSSKTKQNQPPSAIDLTPADDIFFHGHLLPLHFLSHLHASSPRSSTTSLDNLPHHPVKQTTLEHKPQDHNNECEAKDIYIRKPKSFSLSGFAKWVKGPETKEKTDKIRKLKFEVGQFVKRYIKMVKPLLSTKGGHQRKSYSFSGSLTPRVDRRELRDLRGEFSAPASMRTSPTNSGLLLAKAAVPSPLSDSTMEELQAAIQAAIAHCKNSTSSQLKSQDLSSPLPVN